MNNWTRRLLAALATTTLLAACGGGGGSDPAPVPPPVALAPQVTVSVSNGVGLTGSFVITLSPTLTPVTTVNFLTYVNAGFYTGTVFHRHSPNFVLQGGGFAGPMNPSQPVPALEASSQSF